MGLPETATRTLLVVMAHPDDGEFMCGAALARWARAGYALHYCLLTHGDVGGKDSAMTSQELVAMRRDEAQEAARQLGSTQEVIFLDFIDAQLVPSLEARRAVTRVIRQVRPQVVVAQDPTTFWHGQRYINHPDHRASGEITLGAIMPSADTRLVFPELLDEGLEPHKVEELYLTNTTHTDRWVEVTQADLDCQIAALQAHRSQISFDPREMVERGARAEAEISRTHGHDFTFATGFKYFDFRR